MGRWYQYKKGEERYPGRSPELERIQKEYDDKMIIALAKGALRQTYPSTGEKFLATKYFAPSRVKYVESPDDPYTTVPDESEAWVTAQEAQRVLGIEPTNESVDSSEGSDPTKITDLTERAVSSQDKTYMFSQEGTAMNASAA